MSTILEPPIHAQRPQAVANGRILDAPIPSPHSSERTPLVVQMKPQGERGVTPFLFSRLLHLDIHGDSNLTRPASHQMETRARMLLLNLLVDGIVWSLFCNMILHGGSGMVLTALSPLAVIGGLLPALAIFYYEREIVTADTSENFDGFKMATAARMVIILALALSTSVVVDLQLLSTSIDHRVHLEGVRQEAVMRLTEMREADAERKRLEDLDPDKAVAGHINHQRYTEATDRARAASSQLAQTQSKRALVERQLLEVARQATEASSQSARLQGELRRLEGHPSSAPDQDDGLRQGRRRSLQARLAQVRRQEQNLGQRRSALSEQLALLDQDAGRLELVAQREGAAAEADWNKVVETRDQIDAQRQSGVGQADARSARLRRWIRRLLTSQPGALVLETPQSATGAPDQWQYQDPTYDIVDRLRVLWDMKQGLAPYVEGADDEMSQQLFEDFGLMDPDPSDPRVANRAFIVVMLQGLALSLSLVFPLLVLLLKLLSPKPLQLYYNQRREPWRNSATSP